ncbi:MAG: excinuclease ABC subunit UvrC [Sulfurospirillaceae bacterium]|nr:excinuclease ABC subunit UvrC [Sulfurospirillaceae bacterium]
MLFEQLKNAPKSAGVYKFFDKNDRLLYVGKAKIIKKRVASYFQNSKIILPSKRLSLRISKMVQEIASIEYVVVENEHDALILENSLIKQLKPKYNILLRDDKTYPYITIDLNEEFPRFEITRKIESRKNVKYFGPFSTSAKDILEALYACFPLVQKKGCLKHRKACLFYQINKCLAPCEKKVTQQEYATIVHNALEAISERKKLISLVKEKMTQASNALNFEEAARLRDIINSLKNSLHVTQTDILTNENIDVFAVAFDEKRAIITILFLRNGKITSSSNTTLKHAQGFDKDELYQRAIFQFYSQNESLHVKTILVADNFEEQGNLAHFLSQKFGRKITISSPQRGEKTKLTHLANKNAQEVLHVENNVDSKVISLQEIQDCFALQNTPYKIEIFDNSHLFGKAPVGAMVVWENGFNKSLYRKYSLSSNNEYAQMSEMLSRRIGDFIKTPAPDLWIIDGGKALLQLAQKLLKESGVFVDVIAIAKEKIDAKAHRAKGRANDKIETIKETFSLPAYDKKLQFIQKLRDEAHRFAIAYHTKKRQKEDLHVSLMEAKGISSATIKKLLSYFGSFEALYTADLNEIHSVIGDKSSDKLIKFLNNEHIG